MDSIFKYVRVERFAQLVISLDHIVVVGALGDIVNLPVFAIPKVGDLRKIILSKLFRVLEALIDVASLIDFRNDYCLVWTLQLDLGDVAVELLFCCGVGSCRPVASLFSLVRSVIHDGICALHELCFTNLKKRIFCTKLYLRRKHVLSRCITSRTAKGMTTRNIATHFPIKIIFEQFNDGVINCSVILYFVVKDRILML